MGTIAGYAAPMNNGLHTATTLRRERALVRGHGLAGWKAYITVNVPENGKFPGQQVNRKISYYLSFI